MCSNFPIRLFLFKNFTPGQWKCIIQSGDYIFTLTIPRERGSEQSNADQEGGDRYKFTRKYSVWGILLRKLHGMSPFAVKMCFTPTTTTEFLECVYTYIYVNFLFNRQRTPQQTVSLFTWKKYLARWAQCNCCARHAHHTYAFAAMELFFSFSIAIWIRNVGPQHINEKI